MSGIKRFFPVDKRKSPQKLSQKEILLLDSSDDELVSSPKRRNEASPPPPPAPRGVKRERAREPEAGSIKTEAPPPPPPPPQLSAAEVLASIPSAPLPNVSDVAKPNFRQIMERQAGDGSGAGSGSGAGADIQAAPDCLTGLTFVVTGQLPTLGRDEAVGLIKRYGGAVTSSLSGRTSCLVLGEDAGPAKIAKARSLRLKVLDEAGFLQLLRAMPAHGGSGEAAERARARRAAEDDRAEAEARRLVEQSQAAAPAPAPKQRRQQPPADARAGAGAGADAAASQSRRSAAARGAAGGSAGGAASAGSAMWTTKYAPRDLGDICGNNAAVQRLAKWLQGWRAARRGAKSEGSDFRAAMLSGPPGIGKTTAAHLVARLAGFDVVEYNASDTRSKSLLQQRVAQTLANSTLAEGASGVRNLLVIMDEVDGMSAGDRGGVGAMAALARATRVPLILICNERTLPKMRPFDRVVFDIPFRRPDASQIRHRLLAVARAEGLALDAAAVEQLAAVTRSDIRQMLNLLETYRTTRSSMSYDGSRRFAASWNKELVLKPFDIVARLLSRGAQSQMSVPEKLELYFHDYDFAPLMVQENYLSTAPSLSAAAAAAARISDGDLVDRLIHGPQQQWALMPLHALLSCVMPSYAAAGQARGRFNFTSFLGSNSKRGKYTRLLAELRSHIRLRLAGSALDLRLELQPFLAFRLLNPLLSRGSDAIPDVIAFMDQYFITKEDWDVVMELGVGVNNNTTENMAKKLPTSVKSTFTRKYNGMSHPLPFMKSVDSKAAAATGRRQEVPDLDDVIPDDAEPDEPEKDESKEQDLESAVKNDKYIKAAKPKAPPKTAAKRAAPKRAKK